MAIADNTQKINQLITLISNLPNKDSGSGNSPYSYATEFIWTAPSEFNTSNNNKITILHSLGVEPDGFNIIAVDSEPSGTGSIVNNITFDRNMIAFAGTNYSYCIFFGNGADGIKFGYYVVTNVSECYTSNSINFSLICNDGELRIPAGKQYRVLVYKR